MGFLKDKKAVVIGLASNRSIAFGIAKAMRREGAELALTYQNERLEERVRKLGSELDCTLYYPCNLESDHEITAAMGYFGDRWGNLDILVHSAAFAPREELEGDYVEKSTREGFLQSHEISSYSFTALAKAARPLMKEAGGALVTLSYLGAERAIPNYNIMGPAKASLEANVRYMALSLGPENIRVNAISAGPIRTLAASGIANFRSFLEHTACASPLRRNVSIDDVGNTAAFLCSELAAGITGQTIYVDAGYNIVGLS
tara:strand:- start:60 stop:836 length:777 start_codon:yes stop_codon:yes gene_type:complete